MHCEVLFLIETKEEIANNQCKYRHYIKKKESDFFFLSRRAGAKSTVDPYLRIHIGEECRENYRK